MDILGIDIKSGSWTVLHLKRTLFGVKTIKRMVLSAAGNAERLDALWAYISSRGMTNARIAISLPRGSYVSRVLDIPAPGPDAINGILKFELEKHLPYPVEEACFSSEVLIKKGNIYTVYFAAARKDYVSCLIAEFGARGIVPHLVGVEQASFMNAVLFWEKASASVNTAFVEAGLDGFKLDLIRGIVPLYSKSVHTGGAMSTDWLGRLGSELKAAAGLAGPSAPAIKIGRCVVLSAQEADTALMAELSSLTGIEVELGDYFKGTGLAPGDLPAFGAALSASGKGRYGIDLGPSKPDNTLKKTMALAAAVAVCLVLVAASYVGRDVMAMSRFESAVSEIKEKGAKMRALTDSAIEMDERVGILEHARGLRSFGTMDVLKELSGAIPSNTWLTGFEYKGDSVFLEGFSFNASAMLLVLERSPMFKDVELTGQVVKRNGAEHFTLKLRIKKPGAMSQAPAEGK